MELSRAALRIVSYLFSHESWSISPKNFSQEILHIIHSGKKLKNQGAFGEDQLEDEGQHPSDRNKIHCWLQNHGTLFSHTVLCVSKNSSRAVNGAITYGKLYIAH